MYRTSRVQNVVQKREFLLTFSRVNGKSLVTRPGLRKASAPATELFFQWTRLLVLQLDSIGLPMTSSSTELDELLKQLGQGDQRVLGDVLERYRDQLGRMVRLRLDRRVHGRVDPS